MEYKQFYRRKLPHIHSPGATLFVTFRLAGSIPRAEIEKWKQEKLWLEKQREKHEKKDSISLNQKQDLLDFHRRWFVRFEDILHKEETGNIWLKNYDVANLIANSLKHRDGKVYHLKVFLHYV